MLLRRTLTDAGLATYKAKDTYQRTRPFVVFKVPRCTRADDALLAKDGSYPSGHTAIGWAWALVLTENRTGPRRCHPATRPRLRSESRNLWCALGKRDRIGPGHRRGDVCTAACEPGVYCTDGASACGGCEGTHERSASRQLRRGSSSTRNIRPIGALTSPVRAAPQEAPWARCHFRAHCTPTVTRCVCSGVRGIWINATSCEECVSSKRQILPVTTGFRTFSAASIVGVAIGPGIAIALNAGPDLGRQIPALMNARKAGQSAQ
jgi:hypothetical protein